MKKRVLSLVMAAVMFMSATSFGGGGTIVKADECQHSQTRDVVIKRATTTTDGSKEIRCADCDLLISEKTIFHVGTVRMQDPITLMQEEAKPFVSLADSNGAYIYPANFTVEYKNNTKPGTGTAIITLQNDYEGQIVRDFTIVRKKTIQDMDAEELVTKLGGAEAVELKYIEEEDRYEFTLKKDVEPESPIYVSSDNFTIDFDGHYINGVGFEVSSGGIVTFKDGGGVRLDKEKEGMYNSHPIFSKGGKINILVDKDSPHQPNEKVAKGVTEFSSKGKISAIMCTNVTSGSTDLTIEDAYIYSKGMNGIDFCNGNIWIDNVTVETDYYAGMNIILPDENNIAVINNATVRTDMNKENPYSPAAIDIANYNSKPFPGKVVINGGTYQSGSIAVLNVNGNVEINGGTFIGEDYGFATVLDGQSNLKAGSYKGAIAGAAVDDAPLIISGGSFAGTDDEGVGIAVESGNLTVTGGSAEGKYGIKYTNTSSGNMAVVKVKGSTLIGKEDGLNLHNSDIEISGGNFEATNGKGIVLEGFKGAGAAVYNANTDAVEIINPSTFDSVKTSQAFLAKDKFVMNEQGAFVKDAGDKYLWKKGLKELAPVEIISVIATKDGMSISWKKNDLATSYDVYRVGNSKNDLIVSTASTSFLDKSSKVNGQKYTYYVVPKCANAVCNKYLTKSGYYYSAPGITSIAKAAKGLEISWNRNTKVKGYYIFRSVNGSNFSKIATVTKNSTIKYTDTKATTNGAKYEYKIVAFSDNGQSDYSSAVNTYYVSKPGFSKISNVKGLKLSLTWKKNSKASGYQIKYVTGKTTKTITIKKNSTIKYTITKLKKNKTYKVYIRAYKKVSGKTYYSLWSSAKSKKITK